ncbi:MAG: PQQ-binding-like beta-propeller repeat protein [Dehalococcoidia bacterium]
MAARKESLSVTTSDALQGRRTRRHLLLPLLIAVVLVLAGCTQARTAATQNWSGVAVDNDRVFVGTHDGRIIQLEAATGRPLAAPYIAPETDNAGVAAFYGTPTIAGGLLFAGGYQGIVYAMRAAGLDGARTTELDGNALTKGVAGSVVPVDVPAAGAGDDLVVAAVAEDANAGRVHVLSADNLVEQCRYPARGLAPIGQIWSTPTVVDGIVYVGTLDHELHAMRVADCSAVWPEPADLHGAVVAPPFAMGDKVYVGTFDRRFYEVDRQTGEAEELFTADNWFWGGVASDGTRLFIPNLDGRLYTYDLQLGREGWTFSPEDAGRTPILATPAVHGDTVITASDSGLISILRTSDGGLEWDQQAPGGAIRAPLTVSGDILYVHAVEGVVSAIDLEAKRLLWSQRLEDIP